MTTTARDAIAETLGEVRAAGSFVAERTAPADDLRIDVKGVGPLRFPLTRALAQRLCGIALPARYGQGEKTLLDKRVRDTWEVPKGRVRIDGRRWTRTLLPMLEALRGDLGLPEGARLKAERVLFEVAEHGEWAATAFRPTAAAGQRAGDRPRGAAGRHFLRVRAAAVTRPPAGSG